MPMPRILGRGEAGLLQGLLDGLERTVHGRAQALLREGGPAGFPQDPSLRVHDAGAEIGSSDVNADVQFCLRLVHFGHGLSS